MPSFVIHARLTVLASMDIEANSESEARALADKEPDYEMNGAELVDWKITSVKEQK